MSSSIPISFQWKCRPRGSRTYPALIFGPSPLQGRFGASASPRDVKLMNMNGSSANITDARKPEYDFPSRSPQPFDRRMYTKDAKTAASAAMSRTWTGAGSSHGFLGVL